MSIRRRVSAALAGRLSRSYLRRLGSGRAASLDPATWDALPRPARDWFTWSVVGGTDAAVERLLADDPSLAPLRLPPPNGYNLSPVTRLILRDLIERRRPRRVVELGGGVSTMMFAGLLAASGDVPRDVPPIVSIDHDAEWLAKTRERLEELGLADLVRLIHAPIAECDGPLGPGLTYGIGSDELLEAAGERGFDFCLIDGPPDQIGRARCLPLVAPALAEGATIALDDSYRDGEQSAWKAWRGLYPDRLTGSRLYLTDRGLLVGSWAARLAAGAAGQRGPVATGKAV